MNEAAAGINRIGGIGIQPYRASMATTKTATLAFRIAPS